MEKGPRRGAARMVIGASGESRCDIDLAGVVDPARNVSLMAGFKGGCNIFIPAKQESKEMPGKPAG